MKASRFTEAHIIGMMRQQELGEDGRCLPQVRDQQCDLLQVEG